MHLAYGTGLITNLYVGDLSDCEQVKGLSYWSIVHACKHPCYTQSRAKEYIIHVEPQNLYLNMIDHPTNMPAKFVTPMFRRAFDFIYDELNQGSRVLIHCNGGHSRAPSIALACLAQAAVVPNETYAEARLAPAFLDYNKYTPAGGLRKYLTNEWEALMCGRD